MCADVLNQPGVELKSFIVDIGENIIKISGFFINISPTKTCRTFACKKLLYIEDNNLFRGQQLVCCKLVSSSYQGDNPCHRRISLLSFPE